MRPLVFVFIFVFALLPAVSRAADYSNDSDSININYTGGVPAGPSSGGGAGDSSGGTDQTANGGSGTGGSGSAAEDTTNAGSTDVTVPVTVVTDTGGGSSSGGQSSGGTTNTSGGSASGGTGASSGGSSSGTSDSAGNASGTGNNSSGSSGSTGGSLSANEIITTLQGNQAVSFSSGVSSSGAGGGASGGAGGAVNASEAFGTVTLSGKKVRSALSARSISDIILGSALGQKYLTKGDATIAAASIVLKNSAIQEVVLSLQTITLTYTAEGRLFAVFPIDYPLRVSINPNGASADERVQLGFPWYAFFLQTFVSENTLQANLDAAVQGVTANANGAVDAQSRLLNAVNEVLENTLIR